MYQTILVKEDVENGRKILGRLEKQKLVRVTAAFWFHFEEEDQWKLVIVSPDVSDLGPKQLYTTISLLLHEMANDPREPIQFPLRAIRLVSPDSLLYKTVKQRTGPAREGPALDAYIYKVA